MSERLRLAPSPTGFLHLGNLRTALFGYLLAKAQGGQYILRIEDTDQKREVSGAIASLISILDWLGISFDEGPHLGGPHAPYIQSQRLKFYQKQAAVLVAEGSAYRCWCTIEELAQKRAEQIKQKLAPRYDRTCRALTKKQVTEKLKQGLPFVIRQAMPLEGLVTVKDELRGPITWRAAELEDQVLLKSDNYPTYHLASVVDDHLMEITLVTRGEEWLPSLPKNYLLYQACGWSAPKFLHLPLLLNKQGGKLSKRQGDVFVEDFKKQGYLPEALINFCALLGWHPSYAKATGGKPKAKEREIFGLKELEKFFGLDGLRASPAVFDLDKLDYLNGYYIRQTEINKLTELCRPYLPKQFDKNYLQAVIKLEKDRLKKLSDLAALTSYFFQEQLAYQPALLPWKKISAKQTAKNLQELLGQLEKIPDSAWTRQSLEEAVISYLQAKQAALGDYLWPMRVALTGQPNSPGPFEVAEVLGKKLSLARLKQAVSML